MEILDKVSSARAERETFMSSYFFIESKLGDLVIDIQGASTKPGTLLDSFTKKTKSPDWNNQLWTFGTPDFLPNFYFIQSKLGDLVIDIQGASTKPGALLDAFTAKTKYPDVANQLWMFVPNYSGDEFSGYYFIQSADTPGLVIDVQGASTKPGALLDAFTLKTKGPDWDNQLWTFVDEHGNSVTPPPYPS
jgi:hypothetical protein